MTHGLTISNPKGVSNILNAKGEKIKISVGGDFEPVPSDRYQVLIQSVTAINQFNQFKGENVDMLNYRLQILDDKPIEQEKIKPETTRGRLLWKRCSLSLNEKSWLFKLAEATYGKKLTKEELEKFDPEDLVGKQVGCLVEQKPGKDGMTIYNNIVSFAKAGKALPLIKEVVVEKQSRPAFSAPELPGQENGITAETSLDDILGKQE